MPALGAGAALGIGLANRGERPATLPGLGDRERPSQLPAGERRDQLHDRLSGDGGLADRERPSQLPDRNWDQVREDWGDRRDDIRNDWQDHRDEISDDWQDWHDDHYPWYAGWYWGYAPGYWGYWDYLWDEYPVAASVGLTWWGVNSMCDTFGYGEEYYNPYYSETGVVDYSEPIVAAPLDEASSEEASGPSQDVLDTFDRARAAFYGARYDEALQLVDQAAVKLPQDAVLHEFRSLVLFALKRHSESAAAIHAVLAVGPGWDWKTMCGLYADSELYVLQLRALVGHCQANPKAADAWFLLGYHYLTCGSPETALNPFRRASALQPDDAVTTSLIRSLTPREQAAESLPTERAANPEPTPVPAEKLTGTWTASGTGTSKYTMALDKEGAFTWSFARGTRNEEVRGVYAVEGNVLAMEPDSGGVMLAELTLTKPSTLHFQMVGGPKGDPGLDFKRSRD